MIFISKLLAYIFTQYVLNVVYSQLKAICQFNSRIVTRLPEIAKFCKQYFILSKIYADEGGIKLLYHGLSACTGDNPLAKARGLYPRTGGQTML